MPILNWHNFLKSGNYAFLFIDPSKQNKYSEKQITENYEKLIDSLGERKLLNGYYAKAVKSDLINRFNNTPENEQNANNDFQNYLSVLQENINEIIEIDGKKFHGLKDAYNHYFKFRSFKDVKDNRIKDFHFNNFPDPVYDFDLFQEIAMIENYLKRTIDPAKTSVNHYNAIKKQALKQFENEKHA